MFIHKKCELLFAKGFIDVEIHKLEYEERMILCL
jgi:hypothetical protein